MTRQREEEKLRLIELPKKYAHRGRIYYEARKKEIKSSLNDELFVCGSL